MKKRILSLILVLSLVLGSFSTVFASVTEESNKKIVETYSVELKTGQSKESFQNELDEMYEKLGVGNIAKLMNEKTQLQEEKGKTLVSRTIEVIETPDVKNKLTAKKICNSGKIIEVKDVLIHDDVDLFDYKPTWASIVDTTLNLIVGLKTKVAWMIPTIFGWTPGSDIYNFFCTNPKHRDDQLVMIASENRKTKFGCAKDVNDWFDDDYYALSSSEKVVDAACQFSLVALNDETDELIREQKTVVYDEDIKPPHYDDDDFLLEQAIKCYNGDRDEFHETVIIKYDF